jgi:predicted dinucleotide-utilizing enzyme
MMKTESEIRALIEPVTRSMEHNADTNGHASAEVEAAARQAVVELVVSTLWAFHMLVDSQMRIAALLEADAKESLLQVPAH